MKCNSKKCVIAGAILAGGNARRIGGIAKGTLKVGGGVSIVERLINEMNDAGVSDIVIVANDPKPYQDYGVKIIADIREGIGPIGGIEAGLVHFAGQSDAVMFVPCDLPQISATQLSVLKQTFIENNVPVVFAATNEFFWHPLCAVVHNDLVKQVSSAIDCGERKIRKIWEQVKAVRVLFENESDFFNVNSLEDVNQWSIAMSRTDKLELL
jgi:molybdopterin-guanine dinucleotide biosynthesis protein A